MKFRFVQQSLAVDHLSIVPSTLGYEGHRSETFDLRSPFEFGVPLLFGAGTEFRLNVPDYALPVGRNSSQSLSTTSNLQLMGYSVLDRFGQEIPDADIVRSFVSGPDVFLPEPAPAGITFAGLAIIAALIRARAGAALLQKNADVRSPRRLIPTGE